MKYSYHFFVSYFVLILKATALTNQPTFSSTTSNSKSLFTSQYYSMLGHLISVFFTPTFSWRFINTQPSSHFLESVALATVLEIVFTFFFCNNISTCIDSDQSWSLVLVQLKRNEGSANSPHYVALNQVLKVWSVHWKQFFELRARIQHNFLIFYFHINLSTNYVELELLTRNIAFNMFYLFKHLNLLQQKIKKKNQRTKKEHNYMYFRCCAAFSSKNKKKYHSG